MSKIISYMFHIYVHQYLQNLSHAPFPILPSLLYNCKYLQYFNSKMIQELIYIFKNLCMLHYCIWERYMCRGRYVPEYIHNFL